MFLNLIKKVNSFMLYKSLSKINFLIFFVLSKNEISERCKSFNSKKSKFSNFDIGEKSLIFSHSIIFNSLILIFFSKNEISSISDL